MNRLAKIVNKKIGSCDVVDYNNISEEDENFYKSAGFEYLDVERGWDNNWYLSNKLPEKPDEEILQELRNQREVECFSIVNRGQLWYARLKPEQITELNNWYNDWLNVTETKIIPNKPEWLI